jgi:glucose-1-phosphate thymidylyltransferase
VSSTPAKDVVAIVPVAGVGTRLRPHTHSTPKALIHVAGRPILAHILDDLVAVGIQEIILVIGHMGDRIRRYVDARYQDGPIRVHYVEQAEAKGLGHAVHLAGKLARQRQVLIVLGDTIVQADLAAVLERGESSIGVKEVDDPRRFGVVELSGNRVTRLVENPENPSSNLAIVGIYYFKDGAALFDALDEIVRRNLRTKGEYQLTDALQLMLDGGAHIGTFPVLGWYDCGESETLLETNRELLDRQGGKHELEGSLVIAPVAIDPSATIENSIIGPHVSIAAGATVKDSLVRDSIINQGATVETSMLAASIVGENASVMGNFKNLNVGDSSEVKIS